jgi:cytochrome c oxidase subunit 2
LGFQDPATPVAEGIIKFHHDLIFILILVVVFVSWIMSVCLYFFKENPKYSPSTVVHGTFIEVVWTLTPALILMLVAVPSFALLYSVDEVVNPS